MPIFRDNEGNHFDIGDEELKRFKVSGDLPEGSKLSGAQTEAASAQKLDPGAPRYLWPPIELLHSVVANIVANVQQRAAQPSAYNYVPPAGGGVGNAAPAYNYAGGTSGPGNNAALDPRVYNWAPGAGPQRAYNYAGNFGGAAYNYLDPRVYNWAPDVFQGGGGRFGGR
ncbi:MAG TPA: hypothetical protein VN181_08685 [Thermoanaerobaculia bacterium]|nr:hypothetical protein [Thermoanaerobaculia bacterium]